jgi:hypothetical protein
MAKQTFTTGQVLTAAQMTSLQETAMGGGPATAKTASYVLVAADAGTTVAMNAAGATTITVNTGLFAAGDTVFIQNLGAGACTVTAGTATVATAGSLILPQNDAGILYFTATGAAIFYDYIQAGAVSPLTTKGDLYTFSTSDARLGVGANGTTLVADSSEATGLKWQAPAGGGANWSLLNAGGTALTGAATITVSGISGADKIMILCNQASTSGANTQISYRVNGSSSQIYNYVGMDFAPQTTYTQSIIEDIRLGLNVTEDTSIRIGVMSNDASSRVTGGIVLTGCNSSGLKAFQSQGMGVSFGSNAMQGYVLTGFVNTSSTISSISIVSAGTNFDAGSVWVYTSA